MSVITVERRDIQIHDGPATIVAGTTQGEDARPGIFRALQRAPQ